MTIVVMRNVFSHFKHDLLMSLFSLIVISNTEGYFQAAVDTYCFFTSKLYKCNTYNNSGIRVVMIHVQRGILNRQDGIWNMTYDL